ncbi:MAG: hypothetical protein ABIW80_04055 [Lapillicoccus sp.]
MRHADVAPRRDGTRPDLLWRVAVALVVVVAAGFGAPDLVLRVGVLVSAALVVERLVSWRGRGVGDALTVSGGSLLAGVVLVGLVLDRVGAGFGTQGWALGLATGALVVLLVSLLSRSAPRSGERDLTGTSWTPGWGPALRSAGRAAPWLGASLVVVALAVGLVSRAGERVAPPPEGAVGVTMAFGAVAGTNVDVVVTAPVGSTPTSYALRVTVGGSQITYPVFTPAPGRPQTSRVAVPATGRYDIALVDPGAGAVVRALTLAR